MPQKQVEVTVVIAVVVSEVMVVVLLHFLKYWKQNIK